MRIIAAVHIWDRISEFYINAKKNAHQHAYGWDEVFNDIALAQSDTNFTPYSSSKQDWINAGYNVVINKRGWAFAYLINNSGDMEIYDVENYRNLSIPINVSGNLNLYQQLSSVNSKQQPRGYGLGYGISAYRADDGYIYLYKNRRLIPNCRFNEIEKKFYKYKNGEIYAIGRYGDKRFKIYYLQDKDQIKVLQESRKRVLRLNETQLRRIITECVTKVFNEIA